MYIKRNGDAVGGGGGGGRGEEGAVSRFTETDFRGYRNGLSGYRDTETDSLSTETDSLGIETDFYEYRIVIWDVKIDRNTKIGTNFSARQCR